MFRQGLCELGYVEKETIVVEYRHSGGKPDRLPALVAELVRLKVDTIVTSGPSVTRAAKHTTSKIPFVFAQEGDPVGSGLVASLARPGGNITGLSTYSPELHGKRLEILKEVIPRLARVAVLGTSTVEGHALFKGARTCRKSLAPPVSVSRPAEFQRYRACVPSRKQGKG